MPPKTRQQVKADQAAQGTQVTSGGNKVSIWRSEEEVLMMNFGEEEGKDKVFEDIEEVPLSDRLEEAFWIGGFEMFLKLANSNYIPVLKISTFLLVMIKASP